MKNTVTRSIIAMVLLLCVATTWVLSCAYGQIRIDAGTKSPLILTAEEKAWLSKNRHRIFVMGFDPYAGMEYFVDQGVPRGYAADLVKVFKRDLGINVKLTTEDTWNVVFERLKVKSVDILIGANETADRKLYMAFTKAIYKYPYALLTQDKSNIHIIGDVDGKRIGFLKGDAVVETFSNYYRSVRLNKVYFDSQNDAIRALQNGKIDGFITAGGESAYDYVYKYPGIRIVTAIESISSDMTLSTRFEDRMLVQILNKEIDYLSQWELKKMIGEARVHYMRKVLQLTKAERKWLETDGHLTVGVTKNYLPFEYMKNGEYLGISGSVLRDMASRIGVKLSYKYDDFDVLYKDLSAGRIQILNLAKTEARSNLFHYPRPYMLERDLIYGKKGSQDVVDIYGLEGRRIAVVKGYYQSEMLRKNLIQPIIMETPDIQTSMELVSTGMADYFIENPSVVRYYMEELDMYNLVQKGSTSSDTYLYYGVAWKNPEVASILDKLIPLMNIEELARQGYEELPRKTWIERNGGFILVIIGLMVIIFLIGSILYRKIEELLSVRTERELLSQREQFLYTDSLTGLHNRNYLKDKILESLDEKAFPQALIMCDLNNLKEVNDGYGHLAGDALLNTYAGVLTNHIEVGSVIRMGGDEFMVLIEGICDHEVEELVRRLRATNHQYKVEIPDGPKLPIWAAYGCALRYSVEDSFESVIKKADQAMYVEKKLQKKDVVL